jgi:hypothetical protein
MPPLNIYLNYILFAGISQLKNGKKYKYIEYYLKNLFYKEKTSLYSKVATKNT